jgi:hypothetical protein
MIARLGVLCCLVGLAACASGGAATGASSSTPGVVRRWSGTFRSSTMASNANLAPAAPNRGTGTITVTPLGGAVAQMRVDISINTGAGASQNGWAVFSGGCGSPGPMVAGQNQFPPISVSSSGDAHLRTEIAFALEPKGSYHANIYWTPRANDMNDVMMCANLQPEG